MTAAGLLSLEEVIRAVRRLIAIEHGSSSGRGGKAMGVKGHKRAEEVKDPRWIFGLLIVIAIVFAACLGLLVDQSVADRNERIEWWKIIISGASLAVSLFLGSIVAIQAYQYVNRLSHDWKVKHDYAIDRLDRIYGPLWDEAKCIIEALSNYYSSEYFIRIRGFSHSGLPGQETTAHVQRYEQLANSHLQLFLTESVMTNLRTFHQLVSGYDRLREEIRNEMGAKFRQNILNHRLLSQSSPKQKENAADYLWNEISSNDDTLGNFFSSQPDAAKESELKARHTRYLKTNCPITEKDAAEIVDKEYKRLKENPNIEELRNTQASCVLNGRNLLSVLEKIIEKPESALD